MRQQPRIVKRTIRGLAPRYRWSAILGPLVTPDVDRPFALAVDKAARRWLHEHAEARRLLIAFTSTKCCSGVRVCDVRIRANTAPSRRRLGNTHWVTIGEVDGREVAIDARVYKRMPRKVQLTARGIGPFRHLQLDLNGEQWAELLYPVAG